MATVSPDPTRPARPHRQPARRRRAAAAPPRYRAGRPASRPGNRVRVRWGRLVVLVLLVVAVATIVVLRAPGAGASASQAGGAVEAEADSSGGGVAQLTGALVVVGAGETVWDVVLPHTPVGWDATVWVAEVVRANGVDPQRVVPGTLLRLPDS